MRHRIPWPGFVSFCGLLLVGGLFVPSAEASEPGDSSAILPLNRFTVIRLRTATPPITTAAETLQRFWKLYNRGALLPQERDHVEQDPVPGTIVLGTPSDTPALARWVQAGKLSQPSADPSSEAYELAVIDGCLVICGACPRAVLYGVYELEDVIAASGGVPADLRRRAEPTPKLRLLHPRGRCGFDRYRQSDFEFIARCGGNVAHLSHDWMAEKTLFSFIRSPEFPRAISDEQLALNRQRLRQFIDWSKLYGMEAALWLCEMPCQGGPWTGEATRQEFLTRFPAECLSDTGTYQGKGVCLAHPLVEQAYRQMTRQFFTDFPEIRLLLVFTLDSNGEFCDPKLCPRHQGVSKLTQYNHLLTLLQEEANRVRPDIHVISLGWGWDFRNDPDYLKQQANLPSGAGLSAPPDAEAWSFDRKLTDALVADRKLTRANGQLFLGYDIFLWGDDTVSPGTEMYDFPLGIAQKLRRWSTLGVDGVFDQWGTQAEQVQCDAIAFRELTFHPELGDPTHLDAWAESLARRRFGPAAASEILAAWREIETAQQIQSDHAYYWHHLRFAWAGATLETPLTLEALQSVQLRGGEPSKPYLDRDYAPYRDDAARAKALGPALRQVADHFQTALEHLRRAKEAIPNNQRSALDHWYTPEPGAPPLWTPQQLLEEEITAVRLQEKTQRRMSRFFTALSLVKSLPAAGSPGYDEALNTLRQLQAEDEAAK